MKLLFDDPEDWAIEALEIARRKVPCSQAPVIRWANYPTTAGRAFFREFEIRLSSTVLKTYDQVYDTVLHEYAHLVVFEQFGLKAKPHGNEWRRVMKALGLKPTVTHNYPVERQTRQRKYSYKCKLCGFILMRVRPFKRNRIYSHIGCGGVFAR